MMAFHTSATISPLKSFARKSSTAAVKRFAAKLRRIRWRIYQTIQLRKRRVKKTLDYYKNQVDKFLSEFSSKLKPKEVFIWTNKVAKTSTDVLVFLSKAQRVNKVDKKSLSCLECSNKLDSVLFMLSTVLHWVKTQKVEETAVQEVAASKVANEATAAKAADEATVAKAAEEAATANAAEEAAAVKAADEATVAKAAKEAATAKAAEEAAAVKAVEEAAAEKAAKEAATTKEIEAAAATSTKAAKEAVVAIALTKKPLDKDSDEYKQMVRDASNRFLANSGKLDKSCPFGIHVGYAIFDCNCAGDKIVTTRMTPGFPCEICGFVSKTRHALRLHKDNRHKVKKSH